MLRLTGLSLVLALMWWLWSGHASTLLLTLGGLSCLLVAWIAYRMDVVDHESAPLHLTHRAPLYWSWLIIQILRSNLDTCKRILRPAQNVQPVIAELPASQGDVLGRVIYANSITLTPGTLSMELKQSSVHVHALHQSMIDELRNGDMARRVTRME